MVNDVVSDIERHHALRGLSAMEAKDLNGISGVAIHSALTSRAIFVAWHEWYDGGNTLRPYQIEWLTDM